MNLVQPFAAYTTTTVGNIPESVLKRAFKGSRVRLTNANLSGDRVMVVHPATKLAIEKAKKAKRGTTVQFTPIETLLDLAYHEETGEGLSGGSLWSWLKNKALPWVKKNWNVIQPVVSKIADVAIPAIGTYFGDPTAGVAGRQLLKDFTGVGVEGETEAESDSEKPKSKKSKKSKAKKVKKSKTGRFAKGSQAAKDHMAAMRAKRKGGSFRMP